MTPAVLQSPELKRLTRTRWEGKDMASVDQISKNRLSPLTGKHCDVWPLYHLGRSLEEDSTHMFSLSMFICLSGLRLASLEPVSELTSN